MNPPAPEVIAFYEVAKAFCAWCESTVSADNHETQAAGFLARLHASALELRETDGDNEEGLPEIPPPELQDAQEGLSRYNGWYYRTVFDANPGNADEPVIGDVGDDLLDTYKDIKAGLLLFQVGRVEEALWHWSFLHQVHWGKHALGALSALHASRER